MNNDYKKIISFLILNTMLFAFLTVIILKPNNQPTNSAVLAAEVVEEPKTDLILEINSYRQENGLEPLLYNQALFESALESAQMIKDGRREWNHDGYKQIIINHYGAFRFIGENLARNFDTEMGVFTGWKNSPLHNDNLLSAKACEYGLANVDDIYVFHIGCKKSTTAVTGKASYYSREGCLGCSPTMTMANGEPLDDSRLTVAYNDAPLNSYLTITNIKTGQSVVAKVTDTGGFKRHGKIIDLTIATRDAIGCGHVCDVEVDLKNN